MKINKIRIENFYSAKDLTVNFDKYSGIVNLTGKNKDTGGSNGSGKSLLIEAITWCLFGRTIRKSVEDAFVNNVAKAKLRVELTLNDGKLRIVRRRRPGALELYLNDKAITKDSMTETQMDLEKLLNTNYTIFLASLVFGQHNDIQFIDSTPEEKRKIIRNFLNLEELFEKRDRIRRSKSDYSTRVKECDAILAENQKTKNNLKDKLSFISSASQELVAKYNLDEVNLSGISLDYILKKEEEFRKLGEDYIVAKGKAKTAKNTYSYILHRIEHSDVEQTCESCGAVLEQDSIEGLKLEEINALDTLIEADMVLSLCIEALDVGRKAIKIPSTDYYKIQEYQELKIKKDLFVDQLGELQQRDIEIAIERRDNAAKFEVMKFWEVAFSEQGILKYVIKNILDYFNTKVNYYLGYLFNGQCLIQFDESLDERIILNGAETYYMSLSGGEKRKVNLSVLLALHSLLALTDKDQSDMLFFDEVADSLDIVGIKGLYSLLQELQKTKTIFIITHNPTLKDLLDGGQEIKIVKKKGISTVA